MGIFYNMNTIMNVMSWWHCITCEILSSFLSAKAARWSVRGKAWVLVSQARLWHRKRVWHMAISIADQQHLT